jgi:hypothetical protein
MRPVSPNREEGHSPARPRPGARFAGRDRWLFYCNADHNLKTVSGNSAQDGGGIYNFGTLTVSNSSTICRNSVPVVFGADVFNGGVLYKDSSSKPVD